MRLLNEVTVLVAVFVVDASRFYQPIDIVAKEYTQRDAK